MSEIKYLIIITINSIKKNACRLISSLLRRHLRHIFVERLIVNRSVLNLNLAALVDPRQSVLHPVSVITLREIFTSMSTTTFLSVLGAVHSHDGVEHQVLKFESLDQVGVPSQSAISDLKIGLFLECFVDELNTFLQDVTSSEDSAVVLHNLLHLQSQLSSGCVAVGVKSLVESGNSVLSGLRRQGLVGLTGLRDLSNTQSAGTTEDDNVQQTVSTQSVSTVNGDASSFTSSHQTRNDVVGVVALSKKIIKFRAKK
jgi:hypothetical protein